MNEEKMEMMCEIMALIEAAEIIKKEHDKLGISGGCPCLLCKALNDLNKPVNPFKGIQQALEDGRREDEMEKK